MKKNSISTALYMGIQTMILMSSLILTSCGVKKEEKGNFSRQIISTSSEEEQAIESLKRSSVICTESSCPENVAKITYFEKDGDEYNTYVCSGTLIRPGLMLTNSHCIPRDLSYPGADCSKQVKIDYPGPSRWSTRGSESVKCQRVRSVYNHNEGEPDLALIEIDRSVKNRVSLKINDKDPEVGAILTAYTMDPQERSAVGHINKKTCKVVEEGNIFENDLEGKGRSLTLNSLYDSFNTCNVISGNSGSGLFNDKGEIVGALNSVINEDRTLEMLKGQGYKVGYRFKLKNISMGVNIKCLGSLNRHNAPSCVVKRNESLRTLMDWIEERREKSGLADVSENDLYVTFDDNLRLGVINKYDLSGSLSRERDKFIYIDFNKFVESDTQGSNQNHLTNAVFMTY